MEIDRNLLKAGCSKTMERVECKEPSNISAATADHGDDKFAPKEFEEYPIFTYRAFAFHPIASLIKDDVKMDYVRTVGRCCGQSFDDLYLEDVSPQTSAKINLGFDCEDAVPKIGENIEVFGCVQHETSKDGAVTPVFQVWFFRTCRGNVAGYIKMLLQIKRMLKT